MPRYGDSRECSISMVNDGRMRVETLVISEKVIVSLVVIDSNL